MGALRRFFALIFVLLLPVLARADTRVLLVACTDFITQPSLGNAASGNLQMIGSALIGARSRLDLLSVEDGTIGTPDALEDAVQNAFGAATQEDLSILYLCTHGVLSAAGDGEATLLLSDGQTETPLSALQLCRMLMRLQGEKLLILDACYSGALIGHGSNMQQTILLPGARPSNGSVFCQDPSIHVLTSADGSEAGWYYDSDRLQTGAVSYFAGALSAALGLYGQSEADVNADGALTLTELAGYLRTAVSSSTCQLLSCDPDAIVLPTATGSMLRRPLSGFTYGASLLSAEDVTFDFSFTVAEQTAVQYRLVEYGTSGWNWSGARIFMDEEGLLTPGRKTRSLSLSGISAKDSGYLMLQIFAVRGEALVLCAERLIGVQGDTTDAIPMLSANSTFEHPGQGELCVTVTVGVPTEWSIGVYDAQGELVRRLAGGELTRPSKDGASRFYWDGRDAQGNIVPEGDYTLTAEAIIGAGRQRTTATVHVKP